MKLRPILVVTSFVAAAAGTGLLLTRPDPGAQVQSRTAAPSAELGALALELAPGRYVEHRVVLSQDVQVHAFGAEGGAVEGQTSLDVIVRLVGVERTATGTRAALSFVQVDGADVSVQQQDALDDAARRALLVPTASVEIGRDGQVRALAVPPGAHPMFVRLAQMVLAETQMTLGAGGSWQADEHTAAFDVRARYQRAAADADIAEFVRTIEVTRLAYPGIDARSGVTATGSRTIRLARGVIQLQRGEEHVLGVDGQGKERVAHHTSVQVELVGEGEAAAPVLATLSAVDPYVIARDDAAAAARILEQRIDGLTRDELLATLDGALSSGAAPGHERFLWRATGLLQREPTLVASLKPLFFDARTSHAGRALVLDLLVGARHGTAQALLVELLRSPAVDNDPQALLLRQRLSFVNHPTAETLAFVRQQATGGGAFQDPARMSLGAMAGMLARSERDAEAFAAATLLIELHDKGTSPAERDVIVRALGNAGLDGFDGPVLAAVRSDNRDARATAASALRKMRSERARMALFLLARDKDGAVSRRALDSLRQQPFDPLISAALTEGLLAREIPDEAYQAVVSLLTPHVRTDAGSRAALELILTQDVDDKEVKARVRQLLAGLGA